MGALSADAAVSGTPMSALEGPAVVGVDATTCSGVRGAIRPHLAHPLCRTCEHMAHLYGAGTMKPAMERIDGYFECVNRKAGAL